MHTLGDAHLYLNHLEAAETLLEREPKALPTLVIEGDAAIHQIASEDIKVEGYQPHPTIKAPIAV